MRILCLALTLGLTVCGSPQPFDPEIVVPVDEPFALHVGQSAELAGAPLRLRLDAVHDDSRCPVDVVCVWGGNARVELTVEEGGKARSLRLNTGLEPRAQSVDGYRVAVEGLQPQARTSVDIDPEQYVVTLRLTRDP